MVEKDVSDTLNLQNMHEFIDALGGSNERPDKETQM